MKLADRMKFYENNYNPKFILKDGECVICRIDGKTFHTYTRHLKRPYDLSLMNLMAETTKYLIQEFKCDLGYCQSDEISLCWLTPNKVIFDGRINKYNSVLSSFTTAYFNKNSQDISPELAHFDCRTWIVPNKTECANYFFWREEDAIKNAITLAASEHYSHKALLNKNSLDKIKLLQDKGIDFYADYPNDFIRGQYFKKFLIEKQNTDGIYYRHEIKKLNLSYLRSYPDKTFIFD